VLINVSDDVEVFSAPMDVSVVATNYDRTPRGMIIQATLADLGTAVANSTVRDTAVPGRGYHFYYALPGDRFVFAGSQESVGRTLASTSLLGTTVAGVARTVATSADNAVTTGTVRTTQSATQFLLGLSNPISSCAKAAVTVVGDANSQSATLTDLVGDTIAGKKPCTSAMALFSVSTEDEALRRTTENTLTFRVKTIGRHALEDESFFNDFVTLVLTGLEHH
jgi:hypothetical protein